MVHLGRDRVQVGPWKSQSSVGYLVPFPSVESVSIDIVTKAMAAATGRGFTEVFTAALTPVQAEPFFESGFTLYEELHLLRRPLGDEVPLERGVTRRARRADWDEVLELDALAFEPFWQFDRVSLADAIRATPRHRFQVIKTSPVAGYHVTGLAGSNAYIQRVAVHPGFHRNGYGSALVNDSLRWAWRNGAISVQVNTQLKNEAAVALYLRSGFRLAEHKLLVLHRPCGAEPAADTG